ncbi:MAG TPA: hypothetical protein VK850_10085, partial [Candidatus Binatia bacterium]|nr:hypothetical protein [Candidatus Binatia bacterium]
MVGMQPVGDAAYLEITGLPGYGYRLERSVDLRDWSFMGAFIMPAWARLEVINPAAPFPNAFYRVIATP